MSRFINTELESDSELDSDLDLDSDSELKSDTDLETKLNLNLNNCLINLILQKMNTFLTRF